MLVNTKELKKVLKAHKGINSKDAFIPVLKNTMIKAKDGKLTFTTTDLETFVISSFEIDNENFECLVNTKDLYSIINTIREKETEIEYNNSTLFINGIALSSNTNLEEYPKIPEIRYNSIGTFEINNKILKSLLAIPIKNSNEAIGTVKVENKDDALLFIATDTSILSIYKVQRTIPYNETPLPVINATINPKALKTIIDLNRVAIDIFTYDKFLIFKTNNTIIITKNIEYDYPSWKRVIPENQPIKITLPVKKLKDIFSTIKKLDKSDYHKTTLYLTKDNCKIANEKLKIEWSIKPVDIILNNDFDIDINPVNFLKILKALKNKAIFTFSNSQSFIEFYEDKDTFYTVTMPLRR